MFETNASRRVHSIAMYREGFAATSVVCLVAFTHARLWLTPAVGSAVHGRTKISRESRKDMSSRQFESGSGIPTGGVSHEGPVKPSVLLCSAMSGLHTHARLYEHGIPEALLILTSLVASTASWAWTYAQQSAFIRGNYCSYVLLGRIRHIAGLHYCIRQLFGARPTGGKDRMRSLLFSRTARQFRLAI
jgi:hypothetical protein